MWIVLNSLLSSPPLLGTYYLQVLMFQGKTCTHQGSTQDGWNVDRKPFFHCPKPWGYQGVLFRGQGFGFR